MPHSGGVLSAPVAQRSRDFSGPVPQRGETPEEIHYRSLAVREDHAQEHSLSLTEYPEAISFRKNEEKNLACPNHSGGPGQAGRAAGRAHHKNQFFGLSPGEIVALRARTQLRTHARTQRNRNRNRNRFPGWQHPPTSNLHINKYIQK